MNNKKFRTDLLKFIQKHEYTQANNIETDYTDGPESETLIFKITDPDEGIATLITIEASEYPTKMSGLEMGQSMCCPDGDDV